jgi:hypothetical protein
MSHIDIDFNDVPEVIPPIEPGIYDLEVMETPEVMPTNDGKGMKLVVKMKVVEEGPHKDRQVSDHISVDKMRTKIKRLCLSAGLNPGADGLQTEELVGRILKAKLKNRTYVDRDSGEERETASIADYIIPQDVSDAILVKNQEMAERMPDSDES